MKDYSIKGEEAKDIALKVSKNSIIITLILSIFKLFAGIIGSSSAMVSDGVHSASDVLSTVGVIIGINMASKEADEEHPYGHERIENVVAIILAVILMITALGIGRSAIDKILLRTTSPLPIPSSLPLVAALISIATQEFLYRYAKRNAKKVNSGALLADAWHHRTDALSSVGSFIGIFVSRLGIPILDPITSLIISLFILKAALEISKDAIDKMIDKSCDKEFEDSIKQLVLQQDQVIDIHDMKTRMFGNVIYVNLKVIVDANKTLSEGKIIEDHIHDIIEDKFNLIKHIEVKVIPD